MAAFYQNRYRKAVFHNTPYISQQQMMCSPKTIEEIVEEDLSIFGELLAIPRIALLWKWLFPPVELIPPSVTSSWVYTHEWIRLLCILLHECYRVIIETQPDEIIKSIHITGSQVEGNAYY
jgi:hypothetical protein